MITELYWAQPTSPPVNTRYGSENSSLIRSGSLRRITLLSKGFKGHLARIAIRDSRPKSVRPVDRRQVQYRIGASSQTCF